jgi:hypothetical protein
MHLQGLGACYRLKSVSMPECTVQQAAPYVCCRGIAGLNKVCRGHMSRLSAAYTVFAKPIDWLCHACVLPHIAQSTDLGSHVVQAVSARRVVRYCSVL